MQLGSLLFLNRFLKKKINDKKIDNYGMAAVSVPPDTLIYPLTLTASVLVCSKYKNDPFKIFVVA